MQEQSQSKRKNVPFRCDVNECSRKPYMEMYDLENHTWSYMCRWHYYLDRFKKNKKHGYCRVDSQIELLNEIRDSMFYLECEIEEMKQEIRKKRK